MDCFAYEPNHADPFPPFEDGWAMAPYEDTQIHEACSGLIGLMPTWSYGDSIVGSSLYRFFCFHEPVSNTDRIGALRYVGEGGELGVLGLPDAGTLGDEPPPPPPPEGLLLPPQVPKQTDGQGASGHRSGDSECVSYVSDASDTAANAIANSILFQADPVPYTEGGGYHTTVNGRRWLFTMQTSTCDFGKGPVSCKTVWAWRCVPRAGGGGGDGGTNNPPAGMIKSVAGLLVIGALLLIGGGVAVASLAHSKMGARVAHESRRRRRR